MLPSPSPASRPTPASAASPPVDDTPALGGRFELLGELGRGGAATVHLAYDRLRDRQVALKLLHPHLDADPGVRRQLAREVEASTRLRHEATLVATALHELDGRLALSMPFHPGRSLAEAIAADGPLDAEALTELGERLAGALAEAHRVGILHRDITPANVMVEGHGRRAVLTDFGLARLDDGRATRSTNALGTAGYAAPEILDGVRADPRSDLYGLGATLYHAATGAAPFAADTPAGALRRQLAGDLTPLSKRRPDLPAGLCQTIEALLSTDPGARPGGAQELREALLDGRALTPSAASARPVRREATLALPRGDWRVVITNKRHRARDRARGRDPVARSAVALAEAVYRAGRLSDAPLETSGLLGLRRFALVDGVDAQTATRLEQVARSHGLNAEAKRRRPLAGPLGELLAFWPYLIPVLWVIFPFAVAMGVPSLLLLPINIIATILLPAIGGRYGADHGGSALPVVFRGPDEQGQSSPSAAPAVPAVLTRGQQLAARAAAAIEALQATLNDRSSALPAPALLDLRDTLRGLSARARELGEEVETLERAVAEEPPGQPHAEQGWLSDRLRRLDTLSRAGQPVDEGERERLSRALEELSEAEASFQRLEGRLTADLAQLMEIAATATSVRRQLLGAREASADTDGLAQRLRAEAEALAQARAELPELGSARDRQRRAEAAKRQPQ